MKKTVSIILVLFLASLSVLVYPQEKKADKINVLVFSKTTGFRHKSISTGLKVLSDLGDERGWIITATENSNLFTPDFLGNFDVVVFLNPSLDVLNESQQKDFESFMANGKGFVGIHSATDCEYDWPWYGKLVGAYFKIHPRAQQGTVIFEDTNHPAMAPFKGMSSYRVFDEWYSFRENPRANVKVLARLDESSLDSVSLKDQRWQMKDHPIIWYHEDGDIRSFYTGYGHAPEAFLDPKIREHIGNAIDWAAKRSVPEIKK